MLDDFPPAAKTPAERAPAASQPAPRRACRAGVHSPTFTDEASSECDDEGTDVEELAAELQADPEYLAWLQDPWPAWAADMAGRLPAPLAYRQWMHQRGQCELTGLPMVMSARCAMYAPSIVARDRALPLSHRIAAGALDELSLYNFCFVLGSVAAMVDAAARHGCSTLTAFVRLARLIGHDQ